MRRFFPSAPKNYPPSECAKDMAAGLNLPGASLDDPLSERIVSQGGALTQFCPACQFEGRNQHGLEIRKQNGRYIVKAVGIPEC